MVVTNKIDSLIELNGWSRVPSEIITREGKFVNASGDKWMLPYSLRKNSTINFTKVKNQFVRWSLKKYIANQISRVSTHAGHAVFQDVWREFLSTDDLLDANEQTIIKDRLITIIEESISNAKNEHRLWALYRPIQWYIYCAEHYPELGFCPAYALELEGMSIPGNPKGEAVRLDDPISGPLHRTAELKPLINALKNDNSKELLHLQQKAAIALSIAFGRNPANLTYLREEDLVDLTPNHESRCYKLKIPRIKKRQIDPRKDFMDEYVEPLYANCLLELIEANAKERVVLYQDEKTIPNPRPVFVNSTGNKAAILSFDFDNAYNMTSADITNLIKGFAKRHNIMSRVENVPLYLTARRLRYTMATELAAQGISKRELARILDHTDTQHVLVYFKIAGKIVEHLDLAVAKGFARYIQFFKGTIIDSDDDAINGNRDDKHILFVNEENPIDQENIGVCGESSICHLDPPYSCYLCPKFQPYRHADHEHVFACLQQGREMRLKKYEKARLGVQLDDVIIAVANVIERCKNSEVVHG